ncbi:DUF4249 domain-containing protein [Crocinitomicaceae bacterium]|nr:DUF4249 domain-containing protein [Crocinitomicaceae bacterium]MDA9169017.1 DUF4249 domain-containing protein [Crocinitomicaceae bacterium]MDG1037002.1 DUF4249 family protein [Crocinitomicaceae bacterium]
MMKHLLYILLFALLALSCTKEVIIEVPGYEEALVIDGRIETGQPPIVLLSSSREVYAPTDLDAYLQSYISGATVTVSDGTNSIVLDEICSDNLPPGTEELAASMLGISIDQLENFTICAYTSLNNAIFGQVGKDYYLTVEYGGSTYSGTTRIMNPTPLDISFWQSEPDTPNHGYSWATLSDPADQFDAYFWEIKRLNGAASNDNFTPTFNPVFNDEFFDGLTFDFWYENPNAFGPETPSNFAGMYPLGDTVLIKFSKLDPSVFEFFEKKYVQVQTAGNPFATPTNIPTNLSNGALGIWAGFSPSYDTLICLP